MQRIGLLYLLMILWSGLTGQITVTQTIFPQAGDTLHYAVDDQPVNIIMTPPDFNAQEWDFSMLQPRPSYDLVIEEGQAGSDDSLFPDASSFYAYGSTDTYLKVTADEVLTLGYVGNDPLNLGIRLDIHYNPSLVEMRAPVQFFDIRQTSSGILKAFHPSQWPASSQLPVTIDSVRLRLVLNRLDVVDAWGNLTIPGGRFDVLREKRVLFVEKRIDAKVPPLGWLDVTDVVAQYIPGVTYGVDTIVTYYFWNDQSKEPIAVCYTDRSQLRIIKVQYKNVQVPTSAIKKNLLSQTLSMFPNPAREVLHICTVDLRRDDYRLTVHDLLGRQLLTSTYRQISGRKDLTIETNTLLSGTYFCTLSNATGTIGHARFVKE